MPKSYASLAFFAGALDSDDDLVDDVEEESELLLDVLGVLADELPRESVR